MNIQEELQKYDISAPTAAKLHRMVALLNEWNEKMNLVSRNSMAEVWQRHVFDSAQLIDFLPPSLTHLVDIGSGAGFPGLVLAILLEQTNPQAHITLVESITKKTVYLNDMTQQLELKNVQVINDRVENLPRIGVFKTVDVITARAVAALDVLCGYAAKIGQKNTQLLLLKGKTYAAEDAAARQHWQYNLQVTPNRYGADGVILQLTNLRKKK